MPILHEDIWKCVVNPEQVKDVIDKNTRPFCFDVLTAMMKLKKEEKVDTNFLWYNKDNCVENKLCFWKNPYQRGLKYVGDLYEDGQLKSILKLWEQFGIDVMQAKQFSFSYTKMDEG